MAYLMKAHVSDLLELARDFGLQAEPNMNKLEITELFTEHPKYDEKKVKAALEFLRESKRETQEIQEREREREREFELERLRITTANSTRESSPQSVETSFRRAIPDIRKLMPSFNPDETDISLYLTMFERQASSVQIDEAEWTSQYLHFYL